jgi:hypothetical protein
LGLGKITTAAAAFVSSRTLTTTEDFLLCAQRHIIATKIRRRCVFIRADIEIRKMELVGLLTQFM